ncbi:hypothetical protein [Georgenia sp. AZ-5]|uniref:hypothetical protein n=1 Tax=Georgenia sp. AZ-5 TaxID=3367526 RepID=UPI003754D705
MGLSRRTFLISGIAATLAGMATSSSAEWAVPGAVPSGQWQSNLVQSSDLGLVYVRNRGHRLPDFSHAGYRNGQRSLPAVPVVHAIQSVAGDNTAHIQRAIDKVGAMPRKANGFRGALLLKAGTYQVSGTLYQRHAGVVIRGMGDGGDPARNTIIRAVGNLPASRDVLVVGGDDKGGWDGKVGGRQTNVTSPYVNVADATFTVADPRGLRVGDNIMIVHPCTPAWLAAVDGGGTGKDAAWEMGSVPIVYNRYIRALSGNRLTVDVPLFNVLDRSKSQSYVYVWDRAGLVTEVGVEHLRIDIAASGPSDENHAWTGMRLSQVEDAWIQRCTVLHFAYAGVLTSGATRATISQCRSIDPASRVEGNRRYNFCVDRRSQQVLVTRCQARNARHAFVSNGTSSVSGIVFHRCTATGSYTSSEGHRQWSQGLLFDNHKEMAPRAERTLSLYNRGDYGTGHGWSAAHSVAWNSDVAGTQLVVQRPPTAQNYAIGCFGRVTGIGPFSAPAGHIEGTGRRGLYPASLYEAQLADRRA